MTQGRLWSIARRLRPGVAQNDSPAQMIALLEVIPLIVTGPLAVMALVVLVGVTDLSVIRDHAGLLIALYAALLVMAQHTFAVYVEMPGGEIIPISASLANVVSWSAALLLGPTVLWLPLLVRVVTNAQEWRMRRRLHTNIHWSLLSLFSQDAGATLFADLVGLGVYRLLGGEFPLDGLSAGDWLPAVVGSLPGVLLSPLILLPVILLINQATGAGSGQNALTRWWAVLVALGLVTVTPFAPLGALIYSEGQSGLYLGFVAGMVLVNYLAHVLSRANERSQQRARELARLEALGEALIQAPPNLCTLESVLAEHIESMFPQDRVEIRLFEPNYAIPTGLDWPVFRLVFPADRPPVGESAWDELRTGRESMLRRQRVVPPDLTTVYGDALLVKIAADDPGLEGGEKEKLLGGIALLRHRSVGPVGLSFPALQALSSQIASAFYRAQVHVETMVAHKMSQELDLAGRIQARFLPHDVPLFEGWELSAGLIPARQTSGDFYDFVMLPDGRVGLVVADVADKGTAAALYMALSRTLIRTFAMQYPDAPDVVLRAANERLLTDAQSDQFVTVFYAVLDPATGTLIYASAGHNPGFLLRKNGGVESLGRTGVPLGMFDGMTWSRAVVTLEPADVLLLYTDGVSEAQDSAGALFGEDRMIAVALAHRDRPASDLQAALVAAVMAHAGIAPQFDDITLLVAARRGA